jgi:carbon storage regulator CsrA
VLVLTRRLNERIVIPGINATIEVVALKPSVVRLGIEAPPDVTILREEVYRRSAAPEPVARVPAGPTRPDASLRERLNAVLANLAVLRRQLQADATLQAWATLGQIEDECQALQEQLAPAAGPADTVPFRPLPEAIGRRLGNLH